MLAHDKMHLYGRDRLMSIHNRVNNNTVLPNLNAAFDRSFGVEVVA